ncbi:ribonuclease J [Eubacterium sp. F2]|jgi:ribonuclease J|uniref:ribonuclease J n=1 Tax=Eubacterium sp. F2 TaxID=3381348 RepID=UPI00390805E3
MRENNKNNAQEKNTRAKRNGQRNNHSSERRFNSRKSGENRKADAAGDRLGRELGLKPKTQSSARHTANIHRGARTRNDTHARKKPESIKIFPIGGLDEIGKNMTLLEYKDQILIIDCGMSFPDDSMYGIDVVIPDFSYVVKNAAKVKGLIITHGHEDHIGGVPYLLKQINVPIYGTPLSLGLIRNKLEEHGIRGNLNVIHAGDTFRVGAFEIEAIHTTHSIADAVCYFIKTPAARIFHTGDFKIDYTPVDGDPIDLGRLAEIGDSGVDLMMCDSTNVVRPGYTRSERVVGESLDGIFREAENRIIIATFSSNVNRIQKIIELSVKYGRKFAVSGRSMDNVVKLAMELGYLKFPAGSYVELNQTRGIPDSKLTIITTGSQGEPLSALARMAADEHRNVKLKKGDTVILSSTPVPGNEKSVSRVVNQLYQKQVHVIYNENADIHVSGHACQEDLKLMHSLIRPKFFMPVHGEHRHLIIHRQLAEQLGEKKDHIFILSNGDQLTLTKKRAIRFKNVVPAEDIMVDGLGIGDVGNIVLKDRQLLSESGLILVVAGVDTGSGTLVSGPEIVSRGFVYVKENEGLIAESRKVAQNTIEKSLAGGFQDWNSLKNDVRDDLRRFIFQKTRRSPLILPVFLQI